MQFWQKFPFVRLTVALVIGILVGNKLFVDTRFSLLYLIVPIIAFLVTLGAIYWIKVRHKIVSSGLAALQGFLSIFILILFGALLVGMKSEVRNSKNLINYVKHNNVSAFRVVLVEQVHRKTNIYKSTGEVQSLYIDSSWVPTSGKILISFDKKAHVQNLKYGDQLMIRAGIHEVRPPHNPNVFDSKSFYANKNIFHETYVKAGLIKMIDSKPPNLLLSWSYFLRERFNVLLLKNLKQKREIGIAEALVLGIKDDLDNHIKKTYSEVGAMHILAVSGLHVGLVYQVLLWLVGLLRLPHKKWIQVLEGSVLLLGVWSYVFITGLSPSVQRAGLMFSFMIIGKMLHRETNIYNTICASAFFLLCINPLMLLEVGFQLSYLAVLGIVYLQPKIHGLFAIEHKWLDKLWVLTSVSLAAQIATAPISLFYFHQFPNYFMFSNFIAIPAATGILCLGLLKIAVSWIDVLSELVGWVLEKLIYATNEVMIFFDQLPYAVTQSIYITEFQLLFLYGILFSILTFLHLRSLKWFGFAVTFFGLFIFIHFSIWYQNHDEKDFLVYDVRGYTAIGLREGHSMIFVESDTLHKEHKKMQYQIEPHWNYNHIDEINYCALESDSSVKVAYNIYDNNHLITWNGKTIFLINHPLDPSIHNLPIFDFVILRDNVYLHDTFYEFARFKNLIVDSSCTPWYINHHRSWLEKHSAFVVGEKGFYLQQLNF